MEGKLQRTQGSGLLIFEIGRMHQVRPRLRRGEPDGGHGKFTLSGAKAGSGPRFFETRRRKFCWQSRSSGREFRKIADPTPEVSRRDWSVWKETSGSCGESSSRRSNWWPKWPRRRWLPKPRLAWGRFAITNGVRPSPGRRERSHSGIRPTSGLEISSSTSRVGPARRPAGCRRIGVWTGRRRDPGLVDFQRAAGFRGRLRSRCPTDRH